MKSLDERTECGFCTMFLIGQVMLFKETNADSLIKRPNFLVINSQLFHVIQLFQSFYIFLHFLYIHRYLNITNITIHRPDDGSAEPKHYSVDFVSQYFTLSTWIYCWQFFFTTVRLQSIIFFHIYIYSIWDLKK